MVDVNLSNMTITAPSLQQTNSNVYVTTHAISVADGIIAFLIYVGLMYFYQRCLKDEKFMLKFNKNAYIPRVRNKILKVLKWSVRLYPVVVILIFLLQILTFKAAYGI